MKNYIIFRCAGFQTLHLYWPEIVSKWSTLDGLHVLIGIFPVVGRIGRQNWGLGLNFLPED